MIKFSESYRYKTLNFSNLTLVFIILGTLLSKTMSMKCINTDELIKYQADPSVLIIDVREKDEIQETGILPGAINIPSKEVAEALGSYSSAKFQEVFGRKKPDIDGIIVFSCRSGKRSSVATQTALTLGYTNALNYSGGWLAWEDHLKNQN